MGRATPAGHGEFADTVIRSRIEPLRKFAGRLKEKVEGVLAHCRRPLNTSLLEVINNMTKVIKRMAFEHRDDP